MNRSKAVFALLRKEMSGVELCKDMLVVKPTEHIVRGFLIETTTEKDRIYLWRVVTPLYRPMKSIFLDYSTRIPETGADIYIDRNEYRKSVDAIRAIVSANLEYLQHIEAPKDFLRHVSWMIGNSSINFRFDLALTYHRIGELDRCRDMLQALKTEVDRSDPQFRMPVDQAIKHAAHAIEANPTTFPDLLNEWERMNIERLGLRSSCVVSNEPDPGKAERVTSRAKRLH
jgi:hypothetical protein